VCHHGGDSVVLRPLLPHSTYSERSQRQSGCFHST
jgi:hypothetical protein